MSECLQKHCLLTMGTWGTLQNAQLFLGCDSSAEGEKGRACTEEGFIRLDPLIYHPEDPTGSDKTIGQRFVHKL